VHPPASKSPGIYWKIDYYDRYLTFGSEDSADPDKTTRVLTIMPGALRTLALVFATKRVYAFVQKTSREGP
jgi:hypothetical protein